MLKNFILDTVVWPDTISCAPQARWPDPHRQSRSALGWRRARGDGLFEMSGFGIGGGQRVENPGGFVRQLAARVANSRLADRCAILDSPRRQRPGQIV